jgi:predicted transcriptional regulator of viral defense system
VGPLQQDIVTLVQANLARTNKGVLEWLRVSYAVDRKTVDVSLSRLARKGILQRVRRGVYTRARCD